MQDGKIDVPGIKSRALNSNKKRPSVSYSLNGVLESTGIHNYPSVGKLGFLRMMSDPIR